MIRKFSRCARAVLCTALVLGISGGCGGSGGGGAPTLGLTGCDPSATYQDGGTTITVSGIGLQAGAATVRVDGTLATDVVVLSDTALTFTAPAGAGEADVEVQNDLGSATMARALSYYRFPAIWAPGGVRVNTNPPNTRYAQRARASRDGHRLHCVWEDERDGNSDVRFNTSTDGGLTWLASDMRLSPGAAGGESSTWPDVASSGDTVCVAWEERLAGPHEIWFRRSLDGGFTWQPGYRLNVGGTSDAWHPRIVCVGPTVYVAYSDGRSGSSDVYCRISRDRGATWEAERRLDTDAAGAATSTSVLLGASGDRVYVAWKDGRGGDTHVRFQSSSDGGRNWKPNDVMLDAALITINSAVLDMASDGPYVYVVWQEWAFGDALVFAQASSDGGTTWLPSAARIDTGAAGVAYGVNPVVACSGPHAHVAWTDRRTGSNNVRTRATQNGGVTWGATDVRLNASHVVGESSSGPGIACEGGLVHVAWWDVTALGMEVRTKSSRDAGLTWPAFAPRIDAAPLGASFFNAPFVLADGARATVLFARSDVVTGSDIYAHSSQP